MMEALMMENQMKHAALEKASNLIKLLEEKNSELQRSVLLMQNEQERKLSAICCEFTRKEQQYQEKMKELQHFSNKETAVNTGRSQKKGNIEGEEAYRSEPSLVKDFLLVELEKANT